MWSSTGKTCERCTRKVIHQSVTIENKTLSSQCNLTAEIEQVHDKTKYVPRGCIGFFCSYCTMKF
jgi:hypothetical protein